MSTKISDYGREVIETELLGINGLLPRVDDRFEHAVKMALGCTARVVTTGMGKSGAIARKLAATLASTGTPSFYLHPAEGVHGDLGMVTKDDVVFILSASGETDEILAILPTIKRIGAKIIAMVGRLESTLALAADEILDISVPREACPFNLAPTASTTAMLVMGDAFSISIMRAREFSESQFAVFHPAGSLGRRLLLHVSDVMRTGDAVAVVECGQPVRDVLFAITEANAGAACVLDTDGKMAGLITDGDIRRFLLSNDKTLTLRAEQVMTVNPSVIEGDPLAVEALSLMETLSKKIGEIPVLDHQRKPIGMLMLKDLLRTGIV